MSGYFMYSKSNNAMVADNKGCYALVHAKKVLAKKLKWPQVKAEQFLIEQGPDEWHHTSKHYNITDYYDVSDDRIEDLKEELDSFVYVKKKEEKKIYFKCWNLDRVDVRKWDWKITPRFGNNTHSLECIKEKVTALLKFHKSEKSKHKVKLRIKEENIKICKDILKALIA